MWCTLVRTTHIGNRNLQCLFIVLFVSIAVLSVWDFLNSRRYTVGLLASEEVLLLPTTNWSRRETSCNGLDALQLSPLFQCEDLCPFNPFAMMPNCSYISEVVDTKSNQEVSSVMSKHTERRKLDKSIEAKYQLFGQVQTYMWNLTFTIHLATAVPSFAFDLNKNVQSISSHRIATTIVFDRTGSVWKRFAPGSDILLSNAEILWVATPVGGEDWFRKGVDSWSKYGLFGTPDTLPLWSFMSGCEIGGDLQCFNDDYDMRHFPPDARKPGPSFGTPVCILNFQLYRFQVALDTTFVKTPDAHTEIRNVGFKIKVTASPGIFRAWSYAAILNAVVSMIVLMRIPNHAVRFIALHMLGHLSLI